MQKKIAIYGIGTIGRAVAEALIKGINGLALVALVTRTAGEDITIGVAGRTYQSSRIEDAILQADIILDCATPSSFHKIAVPVIEAGKIFMTVNAGALAEHDDMIELARHKNATIIVPTGALLGLDAVRAARENGIQSVTLITRKPPQSFADVPYVKTLDLGDISKTQTPLLIFRGSAREAAKALPQNTNVAAALSFAGIGLDRTLVEVWADPAYDKNEHLVRVEAVDTFFTMRIQNHPSKDNPKTSMLTAASVVAALRQLTGPLRVGS
jgi:aspartate dehydrogenase